MKLVEIRTGQSSNIKTLFETLKDIITETNVIIDSTGMKILTMDSSHTVLVFLDLRAENFEFFACENRMVIGISIIHLYKLIKGVTDKDVITLFIDNENTNILGIRLENRVKNSITTYHLHLLDLNEIQIEIPSTTFDYVIEMESIDFQKICRDMNNLAADTMEIKSIGEQLIFTCTSEFAQQETILRQSDDGLAYRESSDSIVQGLFRLKNLITFTKCTNISPKIDIFLKNDYPLIIEYKVATLGTLKLGLSPKISDE